MRRKGRGGKHEKQLNSCPNNVAVFTSETCTSMSTLTEAKKMGKERGMKVKKGERRQRERKIESERERKGESKPVWKGCQWRSMDLLLFYYCHCWRTASVSTLRQWVKRVRERERGM